MQSKVRELLEQASKHKKEKSKKSKKKKNKKDKKAQKELEAAEILKKLDFDAAYRWVLLPNFELKIRDFKKFELGARSSAGLQKFWVSLKCWVFKIYQNFKRQKFDEAFEPMKLQNFCHLKF